MFFSQLFKQFLLFVKRILKENDEVEGGGCFDLVLFSNRFNLVCTAVKFRCTSQESCRVTNSGFLMSDFGMSETKCLQVRLAYTTINQKSFGVMILTLSNRERNAIWCCWNRKLHDWHFSLDMGTPILDIYSTFCRPKN